MPAFTTQKAADLHMDLAERRWISVPTAALKRWSHRAERHAAKLTCLVEADNYEPEPEPDFDLCSEEYAHGYVDPLGVVERPRAYVHGTGLIF